MIYGHAMSIWGLDHINIDTAKPDETLDFYTELLGLENRPQERPAFDFPGAWLFAGDRAVIHLNFLDEPKPATTGAFNHVAFEADGFGELTAMLDDRGVEYRSRVRPELGLTQIFVTDPNGIRVELNVREP